MEPKYKSCKSFQDGMALVQTEQGYGYINKQGEEVIVPQYVWASDFYDGTAYVLEEQNGPVWLINTKSKRWQTSPEILMRAMHIVCAYLRM